MREYELVVKPDAFSSNSIRVSHYHNLLKGNSTSASLTSPQKSVKGNFTLYSLWTPAVGMENHKSLHQPLECMLVHGSRNRAEHILPRNKNSIKGSVRSWSDKAIKRGRGGHKCYSGGDSLMKIWEWLPLNHEISDFFTFLFTGLTIL